MDTYHTVLFLHFVSLFIGFGAATLMGTCMFRLRAAPTAPVAAPWGMLAGKTERAFPVAILGLFLTGAYMTNDVWTWDTGWIDVAIVALVVLGATGISSPSRRAVLLEAALRASGPGPMSSEARKLTCDPALWIVTFGNPGLVLGDRLEHDAEAGDGSVRSSPPWSGTPWARCVGLQFAKGPAAAAEMPSPQAESR